MHVLVQDYGAGPPTAEMCEHWRTEYADSVYPVWFDPDGASGIFAHIDPTASTLPWTLIVDANANIRVLSSPPGLAHDQFATALRDVVDNPYN